MASTQRSRGLWISLLAALAMCAALVWTLWEREGLEPPAGPADDRGAPRTGAGPRDRPGQDLDVDLAVLAGVSGTIRDPQGQPVAGARVCAFPNSRRISRQDGLPRCVISERDGHYRIDGLMPVRHRLSAAAPGFVPVQYKHGVGAARREAIDLRAGVVARDIDITLEAGGVLVRGVIRDISGGAVEAARVFAGGTLTGSGPDGEFELWLRPGGTRIWAEADGYAPGSEDGAIPGHQFELFLTPESVVIGKVVRAGDGSPIEGAMVGVESGTSGISFSGTGGSVFTDAGGNFRIDGLAPGAYKPRAESDDAFGLGATQVVLGLGETSEPIVIEAHPAFLVEGHIVVAGTGDVCDNGGIQLSDRAAQRDRYSQRETDGQERVRGLLPGTYEVTVHCPGHIVGERYEPVVIGAASVTGLRWEVARGQAIRGIVVDARGQPVPRVSVGARAKPDPANPRARVTGAWSNETDAAGRFELAGLLPGDYDLTVSAWQNPRATPPTPTVARLPEGRDVEDVRIELPAVGGVKGSVRDERGQPVARAQLRLFTSSRGHSVAVADDGSFEFPEVAAGEYRLLASRSGEHLRSPGTGDDDVQGVLVEVRAGAVETVRLVVESPAGRISGVVRDEGGTPLADAFIEAGREPESAAAASGEAARGRWRSYFDRPRLTDADGRFVVDGLPPGKYSVRAQRRGGGEGLVEHVALGSDDVVVTIAATGSLAGTVSFTGGGAPSEFSARLTDKRTNYVRSDNFFRTGGAWSFAELPEGSYELQVTAPEGNHTSTVPLAAGEDRAGVAVELVGRVTVRGTVIDLEGKPVPGFEVRINGDGRFVFGQSESDRKHISDEAGRFEVARVPVGVVQLMAEPRDRDTYAGVSTTLKIAGGQSEVELPPIRVAPRRVERQGEPGELGYTLKRADPTADPLQRRQTVAVVRPGGPAAAAGLMVGDEIVQVDGHAVTGDAAYLHAALTLVPVGTVVRLGLARGVTLEVKAGKRP